MAFAPDRIWTELTGGQDATPSDAPAASSRAGRGRLRLGQHAVSCGFAQADPITVASSASVVTGSPLAVRARLSHAASQARSGQG